jgi:hypothetical protein
MVLAAIVSLSLLATVEPPPPYSAWRGRSFGAPDRPLLAPGPAPLGPPRERARRQFELGADLGVGVPHCARDDGPGCPALTAGTEIGLTVLARPTPYFAFGGSIRRLAFDFSTRGQARARASALFVALVGRVYLLESGVFDPYLELDLGGGALGLYLTNANERVPFAPALRSAAGLDFALNGWLRLGSFLSFTQYLPSSVTRCEAFSCSNRSAGSAWLAVGATSLGLNLGFGAGDWL